jgi:hypothetical protein
MVAACQQKFPRLEFLVPDATNLVLLGGENLDSVVMAFSGMDARPGRSAAALLGRDPPRVEKGGMLIFSSDNPGGSFSQAGLESNENRGVRSDAGGAEEMATRTHEISSLVVAHCSSAG